MSNNNPRNQNGSALAVVIIILVIALIGVLGFLLSQNLLNKETTKTPTTSTTTDKEELYRDWNTYESLNSEYSIKYPKDWLALKETVSDGPYIRNFDPTSKQTQGGYPEGYINVRILREENDKNFKVMTGLTTIEWYDALGTTEVQDGAIAYSPKDVKELKVNGLPAKSAKAAFTETDEVIYILRGERLYSINLYPYGISSDPTVKKMLDSFKFTYASNNL